MLVIGIDPGTAITGYGLVQDDEAGGLELVDCGTITTASDLEIAKRLQKIYHQLSKLINLYQPDSGAVEKIFFHKNARTVISVGQSLGVSMLALSEAGLSVSEYTPLQIKQSVVGYGKANKHQVQNMVSALLGLSEIPKPDDAADALAVAICHLHSVGINTLLNQQPGLE